MRRRHRLTFMIRSAEGSAGKGISSPQALASPLCPTPRGADAYLSWAGWFAHPGRACSRSGSPAVVS